MPLSCLYPNTISTQHVPFSCNTDTNNLQLSWRNAQIYHLTCSIIIAWWPTKWLHVLLSRKTWSSIYLSSKVSIRIRRSSGTLMLTRELGIHSSYIDVSFSFYSICAHWYMMTITRVSFAMCNVQSWSGRLGWPYVSKLPAVEQSPWSLHFPASNADQGATPLGKFAKVGVVSWKSVLGRSVYSLRLWEIACDDTLLVFGEVR